MNNYDLKNELQELLDETTIALGGTDQTYIQFLQLVARAGKFSMPNRLFQGQMIFFKYKPTGILYENSNTYYDQYPLVLVTEAYRGGFEGVNIHHIEPDFRKFLFDAIMRSLPIINASEQWRNRLKVDYDRLNARRIFRFFKPCYRRYTWKGMKKRPVLVPFELWEDMVLSDTMKFINARPVKVYRENRKRIMRND